jgi:hypothetical protein
MDCGGTYNFSGFDGSVISFLLGGQTPTGEKKTPSMEDIIKDVFSQETLSLLSL